MRRVRSAPANLCMMAHSKKTQSKNKNLSVSPIIVSADDYRRKLTYIQNRNNDVLKDNIGQEVQNLLFEPSSSSEFEQIFLEQLFAVLFTTKNIKNMLYSIIYRFLTSLLLRECFHVITTHFHLLDAHTLAIHFIN